MTNQPQQQHHQSKISNTLSHNGQHQHNIQHQQAQQQPHAQAHPTRHTDIQASNQAPQTTNQLQRQKSVRKSLYQTYKSAANSSTYSPPLSTRIRSKQSKSLRFDPYEVPPITCADYLWLLIYYVCLYAFFALFWYSLWLLYMASTPEGRPRYRHLSKSASKRILVSYRCDINGSTLSPDEAFRDELDEYLA